MASYGQQLWYGKSPVRRTNPKPGQSEYYYLDPRYQDSSNGANEIDVPTADSPNPKAAEIQNYLREFDPYGYKTVYGDEPLSNTLNTANTSYDNGTGFSSVSPSGGESANGFAPVSSMGNTQPMINSTVASGTSQPNNWWDTAKGAAQKVAQDTLDVFNPYKIGYNIGESVANVQNAISNQKSLTDKGLRGLQALVQNTYPSVTRGIDTYYWLQKQPIDDTDKHQYLSCVGSTDGIGAAAIMKTIGNLKEYKDIYEKLKDPQKRNAYGGPLGVLSDSFKDLENNFIGRQHGLKTRDSNACEELLPEEYQGRNPY